MLKKEKEMKEEIEALRSALEDTRRELEKRYLDIDTIYRIVKRIHAALNVEELAGIVKDILGEVLRLKTYSLAVFNSSAGGQCLFQVEKNLSSRETESVLQEIRTRAPQWAENQATFILTAELETKKASEPTSLVCLPLSAHQKCVGALATTGQAIKNLSKEDLEVLSVITTQIVVAIENSRLYELTRQLSVTDELTGLYNFQYFQRRLTVELERAKRYNRCFGIALIDIDGFKEYNDKFGSNQGDTALTEIGILLKSNCRESDIVARLSGEEFVIAQPETSEKGALVLAERLRKAVAAHPFWGEEGKRNQSLTISVGVACCPQQGAKAEDLLKRAEQAIQKAKQAGKNKAFIQSQKSSERRAKS